MAQTLSPSASVWRAHRRGIEGFGNPVDRETPDVFVCCQSPRDQDLGSHDVIGFFDLDLAHACWTTQQRLRNGSPSHPKLDRGMYGIATHHCLDRDAAQPSVMARRTLTVQPHIRPAAQVVGQLHRLVVPERHECWPIGQVRHADHEGRVSPEPLEFGLREVGCLHKWWKRVCGFADAQAERKNKPKQPMNPAASES